MIQSCLRAVQITYSLLRIQKLWCLQLSLLFAEAAASCHTVDGGQAFPISHPWTHPFRETSDLRSGFTDLFICTVLFFTQINGSVCFLASKGSTKPLSLLRWNRRVWRDPSPLHTSFLCIASSVFFLPFVFPSFSSILFSTSLDFSLTQPSASIKLLR